jgi:flagellin
MSLTINHNLMATDASRNLNSSYEALGTSVRRLSSGLRVGTAADDAAGLAIRELMRADISSINQGIRNANDAVSMVQIADGSLQVIDEKLIRMKELATQASTGTYNSDQRIIIDSEFQAMANEIQRISQATDFNGIKLLDGSMNGEHDGSRLESTGAAKIHFGTGNDCAEDYYHVNIASASINGLGLGSHNNIPLLSDKLDNGAEMVGFPSGLVSFARIPKGSRNVSLHLNDRGLDDTLQIFTASGKHLVGTAITGADWASADVNDVADVNDKVLTTGNAFNEGAAYDGASLNGTGADLPFNVTAPYNQFNIDGTNFGYSGSGNATGNWNEFLTIDEAQEDLVVMSIGDGAFNLQGSWDYIAPTYPIAISVSTQELAQDSLEKIQDAIVLKDKIRANLGAVQNRLENTIANLSIQAENLQASESRISDVDVSTEMTEFVKKQILTQSATAMLAQANSFPKMAMQLIGG